jgi:hypothetical protein
MTIDPADLAQQVKRLADRLEADPQLPFSAEEIASLREGIVFIERVKALGWWGQRLLVLMAGVVAILSQWERIRAVFGGGP